MKVDPSLIHRLFYPQVPLVLASKHRGRVSAMPVVSYSSVSENPPMVAVSCNPDSYTCKLTLKARAFSLSVLDWDYETAVAHLAVTSGAKVKDKLNDAGLRHTMGTTLDVPVIDGAEATLECKLSSKAKFGDHLLIVGLVKAAYAGDSFGENWDFSKYRPLLYSGWKDGLTTYPGA